MIKSLTIIVVLVLVQLSNAQTQTEDTYKEDARSTLRFDSVSYVENRLKVVEDVFKECPTLYGFWIEGSVPKIGDPQAFWKGLYAEFIVSEVYFSLETTDALGWTELETADVVFKSDTSYYWVHYSTCSNRYSQTNVEFVHPWERPSLIRTERLSEDQVKTFLARIDTLYRASSMESHDLYTGLPADCDTSLKVILIDSLLSKEDFLTSDFMQHTDTLLQLRSDDTIDFSNPMYVSDVTMYAFLELPGLGDGSPILLYNFLFAPEFNSFYGLSHFYDRLKLLCRRYNPEQCDKGPNSNLENWVKHVEVHNIFERHEIDSILRFWPPEVRPNLDSLFVPDMSETEN